MTVDSLVDNSQFDHKSWDFGLTPDQEVRAANLHASCLIFDGMNPHPGGAAIFEGLPADEVAALHGDGFEGLGEAMLLPYRLAAEGKSDLIRTWWQQSGIDVGSIGIPTNPALFEADAIPDYMRELDWIKIVTTGAEIRKNKSDGVVSLWGYDQPLYGIPNSLASVDDAYKRGLRSLMLTYNRMDFVGAGCTERYDVGLSMYGVEVVKRCNDLGLIVDTSHCCERTTLDACAQSTRPVLANHASAKAVYDHARGKSDQELRAIADSGGVVGVVALPAFISGDHDASIETLLDHVDYIAQTVGWQHVGIGTDWPLQAPPAIVETSLGAKKGELGFRDQDKLTTGPVLRGFSNHRDFRNITRGLVGRGYSDEQVAGILGENFMRVVEQVCG